MISKTHIERNLRALNYKFNKAKKPKDATYAAKLAILELCGWIEESMDDILLTTCRRLIADPALQAKFEEQFVSSTYGFAYKKHFKKMLVGLLGFSGTVKLESAVDQIKKLRLESQLGNLKTARDSIAHTYIKGVLPTIEAPSLTISRYKQVYDGLKEYELQIKKIF